jgi:hypothetical protein
VSYARSLPTIYLALPSPFSSPPSPPSLCFRRQSLTRSHSCPLVIAFLRVPCVSYFIFVLPRSPTLTRPFRRPPLRPPPHLSPRTARTGAAPLLGTHTPLAHKWKHAREKAWGDRPVLLLLGIRPGLDGVNVWDD